VQRNTKLSRRSQRGNQSLLSNTNGLIELCVIVEASEWAGLIKVLYDSGTIHDGTRSSAVVRDRIHSSPVALGSLGKSAIFSGTNEPMSIDAST